MVGVEGMLDLFEKEVLSVWISTDRRRLVFLVESADGPDLLCYQAEPKGASFETIRGVDLIEYDRVKGVEFEEAVGGIIYYVIGQRGEMVIVMKGGTAKLVELVDVRALEPDIQRVRAEPTPPPSTSETRRMDGGTEG